MDIIEKFFGMIKQKTVAAFSLLAGVVFYFVYFLVGCIKIDFSFSALLEFLIVCAVLILLFVTMINNKKEFHSTFFNIIAGITTVFFIQGAGTVGTGFGAGKTFTVFYFIAFLFLFLVFVLSLVVKSGLLKVPMLSLIFDCLILLSAVFFFALAITGFCLGSISWFNGFYGLAYTAFMPLLMLSASKNV